MHPLSQKKCLKKEEKSDNSSNSTDQIANSTPKTMSECCLCCEELPIEYFRTLTNCGHIFCKFCLKKHVKISILESRIEVPCPGCPEDIHPSDIEKFCETETDLMAKYEEFSLRKALLQIPDTRWCPAPNCGFAVIVPNGKSCPRIKCRRPECGMNFCFECRKEWKPRRTCHVARVMKKKRQENEVLEARPCPRCGCLIHKINDGSCNHMHCTMCRTEFCWLCLQEINDLHFMVPSGCTFWGKKQWSRKKKLLWQIGMIIGSPVAIAAASIVALPVIAGSIPLYIGSATYKKMEGESKKRRVIATAVAITGSAIVSPVVATVSVVVGAPLLIGYIYVVVPRALVRDTMDYYKTRNVVPTGRDDPHANILFTSSPQNPELKESSKDASSQVNYKDLP